MKLKTGSKRFWEIVEAYTLDNWGEARPKERQIVLHKDDPEKLLTLIHECIHMINFDEKIGITEKQVLKIEKWIKKFIRHNDLEKILEFVREIAAKSR